MSPAKSSNTSKETPNNAEKIESAPERNVVQRLLLAWGVLVAILVVVLFIGRLGSTSVQLGIKHRLQLERVSTPEAREKGLSGRNELPKDQGMLFVFASPSQYCMWMKDMKFNIDIVWLDQAKQVIKIERNVSPRTYPNTFCPEKDATYVIEVSAGVVSAAGIKVGDTINVR